MITAATVLFLLFPYLCISGVTVGGGIAAAVDQRSYGQKKEVSSSDDARKALTKYFAKKKLLIGEITEKDLYFEAEIKDSKDAIVDKVIIDKRTGRIRSIY